MSSHRTVRSPSREERQQLERMTREEIGRVAMRAQMVLLSARSFTAQEIAEIQSIADVTVYKWLNRFDEGGPEGLYDRGREGRPPKLGEEAEEEIERVLEEPPTEEGYNATRWTAPRLARHLEEELGVAVHPETVRRALRRLEFSWKRPRRKLPPDPDYAEHVRALAEAIATAGVETTILFEDETQLKRFPPLRRMWMPTGQQWSVDVPASNDKFCLYGALRYRDRRSHHRALSEGQVRAHQIVHRAVARRGRRRGSAGVGPGPVAHLADRGRDDRSPRALGDGAPAQALARDQSGGGPLAKSQECGRSQP